MSFDVKDDLASLIDESICIDQDALHSISDEELVFLLHLELYMDTHNKRISQTPRLHDDYLSLYQLASVVQSCGGFEQVKIQKRWKEVAKKMGATQIHVSTFKSLKHSYMRFIEPFLTHIRTLGSECCKHFINPIYTKINNKFIETFDVTVKSEHASDAELLPLPYAQKPKPGRPKKRTFNKMSYRKTKSSSITTTESASGNSSPNSGDYHVYDDSKKIIKTANKDPLMLVVGDKIHVRYSGLRKKYEALIIGTRLSENGTPEFRVHYDGWSSKYDEWINDKTIVGKIDLDDSEPPPPKKRRGRKPKSLQVKKPSTSLQEESSSEKKKTRLTYNSLQDELMQAVIENSLKEFQQSSFAQGESKNDSKVPSLRTDRSESTSSESGISKVKRKRKNNRGRPKIQKSKESNDANEKSLMEREKIQKMSPSPTTRNLSERLKETKSLLKQYIELVKHVYETSDYKSKGEVLTQMHKSLLSLKKICP
ncbi:hypothetical protein RF11_10794 [Thelohanellus kitauei]|uniref:ARID domain-containing protein n=1 Tax=Thelohanellus kitauei TaxID=669202 RepID=A0A0C2N3F6_THEKT|nr:hypothetical protein RF11_10794 [Thelohanellus kitauei]